MISSNLNIESVDNRVIDNNARLIDAIKRIRPELPVYGLGDAVKGLAILSMTLMTETKRPFGLNTKTT